MDQKDTNLIKDLGLDTLPEEQKNEVVASLSQALQNRITLRVMDTLSEEEKQELEALVEAGDNIKVGEWIAEKVPGLNDIAKDEYEKMRAELLSANEDIKEEIAKLNKE